MKVAVASGKGGTGKTTIAVNLAWFLADNGRKVQYIDCDVEEPNGHFFIAPDLDRAMSAIVMLPVVDQQKCTSCGECSAKCQFNAIVRLPGNTLIFPELCHGCGLCLHVCPTQAISEDERQIGIIETGMGWGGIQFAHGILNVGEPQPNPLIRQVKQQGLSDHIQIIDAPPGTSCSFVETISDADMVILVTEPTPFGLHDLKISVSVAHARGKSVLVVINRENGLFPPLEEFLEEKHLKVLARLPEDRRVAEVYSCGDLLLETLPEYGVHFSNIAAAIFSQSDKTGFSSEEVRP
jgi:MinD superfamily P-loop ATPase